MEKQTHETSRSFLLFVRERQLASGGREMDGAREEEKEKEGASGDPFAKKY